MAGKASLGKLCSVFNKALYPKEAAKTLRVGNKISTDRKLLFDFGCIA